MAQDHLGAARRYYEAGTLGFEKKIKDRLDQRPIHTDFAEFVDQQCQFFIFGEPLNNASYNFV